MGVAHWVAALIGIFVVTLVFLPMFTAFDTLSSVLISNMPNASTGEGTSISMVINAFYIVPLILVFGLLLYAIASTERREYESTRDQPEF